MHETYTLHSILNNFFLSPASQIQVTLLISSLFLNIRTVSSQKSIYLNNISFPDNTQDVFIPAYLCRDFKIHNSNLSIPPIFPICQTFVSHFLAYRVGNTESINWTPVVPSSLHFFFFLTHLGLPHRSAVFSLAIGQLSVFLRDVQICYFSPHSSLLLLPRDDHLYSLFQKCEATGHESHQQFLTPPPTSSYLWIFKCCFPSSL